MSKLKTHRQLTSFSRGFDGMTACGRNVRDCVVARYKKEIITCRQCSNSVGRRNDVRFADRAFKQKAYRLVTRIQQDGGRYGSQDVQVMALCLEDDCELEEIGSKVRNAEEFLIERIQTGAHGVPAVKIENPQEEIMNTANTTVAEIETPTLTNETVSGMFVAQQEAESRDIDEGRRKPTYRIVLEIEGSKLEAMSKKAKAAFGESLMSVEKVARLESRADQLGVAEAMVQDALEIVEELKGEMEEWRESIPESLQSGEKYSEVEDTVTQLEELESSLNDISFENVEFPSMY